MTTTISKCFTGFASHSYRLLFGRSLLILIHTSESIMENEIIKPMLTIDELIKQLKALQSGFDKESSHVQADQLLLEFIDDPRVTEAFKDIDKWYA